MSGSRSRSRPRLMITSPSLRPRGPLSCSSAIWPRLTAADAARQIQASIDLLSPQSPKKRFGSSSPTCPELAEHNNSLEKIMPNDEDTRRTAQAPVAQWLEQRTHNSLVLGSSPGGSSFDTPFGKVSIVPQRTTELKALDIDGVADRPLRIGYAPICHSHPGDCAVGDLVMMLSRPRGTLWECRAPQSPSASNRAIDADASYTPPPLMRFRAISLPIEGRPDCASCDHVFQDAQPCHQPACSHRCGHGWISIRIA